jgi:hypothetical protein
MPSDPTRTREPLLVPVSLDMGSATRHDKGKFSIFSSSWVSGNTRAQKGRISPRGTARSQLYSPYSKVIGRILHLMTSHERQVSVSSRTGMCSSHNRLSDTRSVLRCPLLSRTRFLLRATSVTWWTSPPSHIPSSSSSGNRCWLSSGSPPERIPQPNGQRTLSIRFWWRPVRSSSPIRRARRSMPSMRPCRSIPSMKPWRRLASSCRQIPGGKMRRCSG